MHQRASALQHRLPHRRLSRHLLRSAHCENMPPPPPMQFWTLSSRCTPSNFVDAFDSYEADAAVDSANGSTNWTFTLRRDKLRPYHYTCLRPLYVHFREGPVRTRPNGFNEDQL